VRSRLPLLLAAALLALVTTACTGHIVADKTAEPAPPQDGQREGYLLYTVALEVPEAVPAFGRPGIATNVGAYIRIATPDDRWTQHCYNPAVVGEPAPSFCATGYRTQETVAIALSFPLAGILAWLIAGRTLARMPHREFIVPRRNEPIASFRHRQEEALAGYRSGGFSTRRYLLLTIGAGVLLAFLIAALLTVVVGRNLAGNWAFVAAIINTLLAFGYITFRWFGASMTDAHFVRIVFIGGFILGLGLAGISL